MMSRRRARKLLVILPLAVIAAAVFGFVVMGLWNWLVPAMFGGKIITFWQAIGVLVLSRILFGGFKGHRSGWNSMTAEEREKFRAGMRQKCGPRPASEPVS
jgi:F0F1-type ATP synthase assembly protein I